MNYKNIGIYHICRKLNGCDDGNFRHNALPTLYLFDDPDREKITIYKDETELGVRCCRTELSHMFADAAEGKLDCIRIGSYFDLWHDAKTSVDAVQKLRVANPSIVISIFGSLCERILFDFWNEDPSFNRLAMELLYLQRMDGELRFLQEYYQQISPQMRNSILQYFIDPTKVIDFLDSFYLKAKGMELEDLEGTLGLSKTDVELIRIGAVLPDESHAKLMAWLGRDLIDYYLV